MTPKRTRAKIRAFEFEYETNKQAVAVLESILFPIRTTNEKKEDRINPLSPSGWTYLHFSFGDEEHYVIDTAITSFVRAEHRNEESEYAPHAVITERALVKAPIRNKATCFPSPEAFELADDLLDAVEFNDNAKGRYIGFALEPRYVHGVVDASKPLIEKQFQIGFDNTAKRFVVESRSTTANRRLETIALAAGMRTVHRHSYTTKSKLSADYSR